MAPLSLKKKKTNRNLPAKMVSKNGVKKKKTQLQSQVLIKQNKWLQLNDSPYSQLEFQP